MSNSEIILFSLFLVVCSLLPFLSNSQPCPYCWNGGICNTTTGICECQTLFKNDLSRGIINCSVPACVHGQGPDENGFCTCDPGWSGISCTDCESNQACFDVLFNKTGVNSTGLDGYCDKGYVTHQEKSFKCHVTDPNLQELIGPNVTFSCRNASFETNTGICEVSSWAYENGIQAQVFFCTIYGCRMVVPKEEQIRYECLSSECRCANVSSLCNEYVQFVIGNMHRGAWMECSEKTNACTMKHDDFPAEIQFNCYGAECLPKPADPPVPEPPNYLYVALASSIGGVLGISLILIIIISSICSAQHTKKARLEYQKIGKAPKGCTFEFTDICYTVWLRKRFKKYEKKILHSVSFSAKPGKILAIMGPSGCGKTTLLDILAGRSKRGKASGKILVDGKRRDSSFKRTVGYVFQDDLLMSTLTVKECLMFSADLRLPDCISRKEKEQRVKQVLKDLRIEHIADTKIGGGFTRGISGGEKKRVCIGMELVVSPRVLFLDEPTSGLDSYNAYVVVKCLSDLAKQGRTIILSIHQPRQNIFRLFDDLLLMKDGRVIYAGKCSLAEQHFKKLGYTCPPDTNVADFLIDVLTEDDPERKRIESEDTELKEVNIEKKQEETNQSSPQPEKTPEPQKTEDQNTTEETKDDTPQKQGTTQDTKETEINADTMIEDEEQIRLLPYATSFYSQLLTLMKRSSKNFVRNIFLMPVHYIASIVAGIGLGLVYFQLSNDIAANQNRLGTIFFMCSLLCFGAMSSLEIFISEREIYVRERANGFYKPLAYVFSKVVFDIVPLRIIPPILMGSIAYYMIGLRAEFDHFLWFILLLVLFNIISGGMCLCIAAIAPNIAVANIFTILAILLGSLFSGFLLNNESTPVYLSWCKYLSFWYYTFEAMCINEFDGFTILINPKGLPAFSTNGNFWLRELGMDPQRFSVDVIMMIVFAVGFLILTALLLQFFVKEKR